MDAFTLVITVVLVTLSGALAPGPLFFATLAHGARSGAKSGLTFAVAHTIIEFALVMILAGGLLTIASELAVRTTIGIVGGVVLLAFGAAQIYGVFHHKQEEPETKPAPTRNLLFMGLALTGLNPFFIIWWLTAGANLILISLEFASLAGVVFMYVCHVWMDYLWLGAIAHFAKVGANVAGFRWYKLLMVLFGAILIYFGLTFILETL